MGTLEACAPRDAPASLQGMPVNAGPGLHLQALVAHDIELFLGAVQIAAKQRRSNKKMRDAGRLGLHLLG